MKFARLSVILFPFVIWLLAQVYFIWPELFYLVLSLSIILTIVLTFTLKQPGPKTPWWVLAILPVSFLTSITVYISLQASSLFIQFLFLALAIFLFNYFKNLYYFWQRPDLYQEEDNVVIRAYGSFLVIFFSAAVLYGLQSLISLTAWPMMIIFFIVTLAVISLNLVFENFETKTSWQFSVMIAWLITQMALVFSFLPLSYNVSALSVGIVYYLLINLARLYLQKALSPRKIKLYLTLSYAGLAFLLLTARWLN
jgi:hypothetical protein